MISKKFLSQRLNIKIFLTFAQKINLYLICMQNFIIFTKFEKIVFLMLIKILFYYFENFYFKNVLI